MGRGKAGAMRSYNEFQVKQLTRLIEVTRTNLSRADRQKVGGGGRRIGCGLPPCSLLVHKLLRPCDP